ncbi:MAG TPA: nicotinate-nucleotide adenylyltransferase [Pyrinomonadaceae bacterium]|jgi:nicotinate-nucleotide adenylyltransferase
MSDLKIAFYGGSFDPPHLGHMAVADALLKQFELDEFVFLPAFHAPHKKGRQPTPAYDRYAMLCLATQYMNQVSVSRIEIEMPEKPYSYETLGRITELLPRAEIYFVMGADSWDEITTWREWEEVLSLSNHIVITRPGFPIRFDHVTDEIRERIVDLRDGKEYEPKADDGRYLIYITDAVSIDISATDIRKRVREDGDTWRREVPKEVANYIEKYQIYN